jgi:peptidoglycan/xylan/chitin deacetylase (PgdA/CDA1 family)
MKAGFGGVPLVLMYHSVEAYTRDPHEITVAPQRFDRQMRWLRHRGLRGTSVRELLRARRNGRGAGLVGLTFDDGYTDFLTHALPILSRYGFTATVYVVAGALGGHNTWDEPGPRKPLMTADDVRRAARAGMEVGSHSLTHQLLPPLSLPAMAKEVRHSRSILGDLIGGDVGGFCYPYGVVGAREVTAVREAGYDYACAVRPSGLASRHALPRTYIGDRDTSPRLFAKYARHLVNTRRGVR